MWSVWAAAPGVGRAAGPSPATYTVRAGDNLSLVAARFGTSVDRLRRDNDLRGDLIRVGQDLRLAAPFAGGGGRPPAWGRPVARPGPVLRPFGPYRAGGILMPRTGIELACPVGTRLHSPAVGVVRYSGVMDGYGHLLIIEHADRYATVLAPCDPASLAVREGQAVLGGDLLGRTAGPVEPGAEPYVHLELRRDDKAIPPDRLIR